MAPIRDAINDAVQEIVMLTGFYKRQCFIPLREGAAFYRLQLNTGAIGWITDAWSVTQQVRLEQTDLLRLAAYDPRWMIYTGNPEAYFPVGKDIIGFYPKPPSDGNVIELTVVEIPDSYATGEDRVKLRESLQYAAVAFAVSEYWASRGDASEAQVHLSRYLDALGVSRDYLPFLALPRFAQTQKAPWPQVTG
jgi:hypothetical protein